MLTREDLTLKLQSFSLWTFVFQLGVLVGIEAVFLAVFTENAQFQVSYGFPALTTVGLATSLYPIFAAIGAVLVLYLVHLTGPVVIICGATFIWLIGYSVGSLLVGTISALMAARIVKGLAIGLITSILPVYIERVAHSKRQAAKLLTLLQAAAPLGILLMALLAKLLTPLAFNVRWICAAAPALPIVLVVFYLPHSRGVINQAREKHQASKCTERSAWSKMVSDIREIGHSKSYISRFIAASLAQGAVPLTAINVVFYYSAVLCQMLGFSAEESEYMAIGLYATNFLGTALSLLFINRLHRLVTLQYAILGLGIVHIVLFLVRMAHECRPTINMLGIVSVALLFGFVFLFSLLLAGISLVYTSEVVPKRTRGVSIGLATSFGWVCNFVVTIVSAAILPVVSSYIFLIFASICCTMYCTFSLMPQAIIALNE